MAGQRLLFLTVLALELLERAGGSQPALRSLGAAAACRLDSKESESWGALLSGERLDTWICSLLGSLMVGLSGVFPLLVIPLCLVWVGRVQPCKCYVYVSYWSKEEVKTLNSWL